MAGEDIITKDQAIDLLRQYRQAINQAGIPVSDLILFGSVVKSATHYGSDIDVAVVSDSFGTDYHEELGQLMKCRRNVSLLIEPHPFHPDDLNNRWDTLAQEIKKYGIRVD